MGMNHRVKRWLVCERCNTGFSAVKIDARFCSKRCTKAASRYRAQKAEMAAAAAAAAKLAARKKTKPKPKGTKR